MKWCKNGVDGTVKTPETIENKGDVRIYEIRYRNQLAFFHKSIYLNVSP